MSTAMIRHELDAGPAPAEAYLGRQPIVDRERRVVAYELLFRDADDARAARVADNVAATRQVLVNAFDHFGVDRILGRHRAFINISARALDQGLVELLPPQRVVLEIMEHVAPTARVLDQCRRLRALGYEFALDDFVYSPELEPLLGIARYVKLDIQADGIPGAIEQWRRLRRDGIVCIAEKVETPAELRACQDLGIRYFQGDYLAPADTLRIPKTGAGGARLLRLFALAVGKADPARIAREFRHDFSVSLALLGTLAAADHALAFKPSSIPHALSMLGHFKLARCLALLLLRRSPGASPVAVRRALVRARLTELLGQGRFPQVEHDALFLCGALSASGRGPAAEPVLPLDRLCLPPLLAAAVLRAQGPYAPCLALAIASERGDPDAAASLARSLGLDYDGVARLRAEAVAWAERLPVTAPG